VSDPAVRTAWDAEYRAGRYLDEPPVPFVHEILATARARGIRNGLYIGCGNGRNFVPLTLGGLELEGVDLSPTAIAQLAARLPESAGRLVVGNLAALPSSRDYPLVIGLQVFQHGDLATCRAHLAAAQQRVRPGGLFALRVNAVATEVEFPHDVVEGDRERGFTVRYRSGPKQGLLVHFFGGPELAEPFAREFVPVAPLRVVTQTRTAPSTGTWSQWEGIWERRSAGRSSAGADPARGNEGAGRAGGGATSRDGGPRSVDPRSGPPDE